MENVCLGEWSGLKYAIIFSSDDPGVFFEVLRLLGERKCVVHFRYGPTDGYIYLVTYHEKTDKARMLREVARLIRG